jgi:hypothetical protein
MHGTFRSHVEDGRGVTVRFAMPVSDSPSASRKWRAKLAALLAGCCVAALPPVSLPTASRDAESRPSVRPKRAVHAASIRVVLPAPVELEAKAPQPVTLSPHARTILVAPTLPSQATGAAAVETVANPEIPKFEIAPLAAPPVAVIVPDFPSLPVIDDRSATAPVAGADGPATRVLRPVDVEQVADSEERSLRVPQLNEPALAVGVPVLSARIAAMQVTPLPPARLRDSDRAVLLAEAPTRLTLRIGKSSLGKVDFRMSEGRTIDVKLSGLLDLLAGQYDAAEFARLRTSAAADAYVSFDQLRALGLNVRYDPVYDELRING